MKKERFFLRPGSERWEIQLNDRRETLAEEFAIVYQIGVFRSLMCG